MAPSPRSTRTCSTLHTTGVISSLFSLLGPAHLHHAALVILRRVLHRRGCAVRGLRAHCSRAGRLEQSLGAEKARHGRRRERGGRGHRAGDRDRDRRRRRQQWNRSGHSVITAVEVVVAVMVVVEMTTMSNRHDQEKRRVVRIETEERRDKRKKGAREERWFWVFGSNRAGGGKDDLAR
ncbi:hypothetical protein AOLI_G00237360 [Acnodon oligacanthus]